MEVSIWQDVGARLRASVSCTRTHSHEKTHIETSTTKMMGVAHMVAII